MAASNSSSSGLRAPHRVSVASTSGAASTGPDAMGNPIAFYAGPYAGKVIHTTIEEVQKPDLGRKFGQRDSRPLDPPPVVQIKMYEISNYGTASEHRREIETDEVFLPGLICYAELYPYNPDYDNNPQLFQGAHPTAYPIQPSTAPRTTPLARANEYPPSDLPRQPRSPLPPSAAVNADLHGEKHMNAVVVPDIFGTGRRVMYFVFPELQVRSTGHYMLKYRAMHVDQSLEQGPAGGRTPLLAECWGGVFAIYPSKTHPALRPSTELTNHLSRCGSRLHSRQSARVGRPSAGKPHRPKAKLHLPLANTGKSAPPVRRKHEWDDGSDDERGGAAGPSVAQYIGGGGGGGDEDGMEVDEIDESEEDDMDGVVVVPKREPDPLTPRHAIPSPSRNPTAPANNTVLPPGIMARPPQQQPPPPIKTSPTSASTSSAVSPVVPQMGSQMLPQTGGVPAFAMLSPTIVTSRHANEAIRGAKRSRSRSRSESRSRSRSRSAPGTGAVDGPPPTPYSVSAKTSMASTTSTTTTTSAPATATPQAHQSPPTAPYSYTPDDHRRMAMNALPPASGTGSAATARTSPTTATRPSTSPTATTHPQSRPSNSPTIATRPAPAPAPSIPSMPTMSPEEWGKRWADRDKAPPQTTTVTGTTSPAVAVKVQSPEIPPQLPAVQRSPTSTQGPPPRLTQSPVRVETNGASAPPASTAASAPASTPPGQRSSGSPPSTTPGGPPTAHHHPPPPPHGYPPYPGYPPYGYPYPPPHGYYPYAYPYGPPPPPATPGQANGDAAAGAAGAAPPGAHPPHPHAYYPPPYGHGPPPQPPPPQKPGQSGSEPNAAAGQQPPPPPPPPHAPYPYVHYPSYPQHPLAYGHPPPGPPPAGSASGARNESASAPQTQQQPMQGVKPEPIDVRVPPPGQTSTASSNSPSSHPAPSGSSTGGSGPPTPPWMRSGGGSGTAPASAAPYPGGDGGQDGAMVPSGRPKLRTGAAVIWSNPPQR